MDASPPVALSDVASQWVGEKSARVRQAFEQAKRNQPCLLFMIHLVAEAGQLQAQAMLD